MNSKNQTRFLQLVKTEGSMFAERYFWHASEDWYVLFLAEFFLRRTNRITVSRNLASFLERFPTAEILAQAEPASVIAQASWAGLRRRTAQLPLVVSRLMERASWTASDLTTLPHIGVYAAEGIALYVFGQAHFPVDNNVGRVVGRYFGATDLRQFDQIVREVSHAAQSEGGLVSLKATHMGVLGIGWDWCRKNPSCSQCPLAQWCAVGRGELSLDSVEATFSQ